METRPRTTPKLETQVAFAINVSHKNLILKLHWLRTKMAMNLQERMPPKRPVSGRMKHGPLFRKRVIVKQVWMKGL